MASAEWLEIYADYTADELNTEITALKKAQSIFVTQAVGSKSFTRDLQELKNKLSSAIRIRNERGSGNINNQNMGVADFSKQTLGGGC